MSEDASYHELNPCGENVNSCRAIVKYEPPSDEILWTVEDVKFLIAVGISID